MHEQNIAGRDMRFVYDQHAEAADAVLLRWSMLTPDGRIQTVYMFMGIA